MIIEIEKLKKIDDIISCEGSVLSVYNYGNYFFLASFLIDGTGTVFYSTNHDMVLSYLNSSITLSQLYQASDDIFVSRVYQRDTTLFLSNDFQELIQFGKLFLNEINKDMINTEFIKRIYNGTFL
jgi:hypothetical protein